MSTQDKSSDNMVQSDFLRNIEEDDDITTAVAASLETPQGVPHERVQRPDMGWSPKTSEDWMTYNRQKAAIDEAEQNSKYCGPHPPKKAKKCEFLHNQYVSHLGVALLKLIQRLHC